MIIAIDFDGPIAEDRWPEIGPMTEDAAWGLRELANDEHALVLWTCREGEALREACAWLVSRMLDSCFSETNANPRFAIDAYGTDPRKIGADVYIDDKNLGGFPGWKKAVAMIGAMQPQPPYPKTKAAEHVQKWS